MRELILPELILFESYNGNFALYNEAVYAVFRNDFIKNRPVFQGKRLALKAHPLVDGKEYTYYHFTHSGDVEMERIPDMRRMERIGFPKPIIEFSDAKNVKVWRNQRGRSERILILHENERYLVVLDDRKDYILPWTAYLIDHDKQHQKLLAEHDQYHLKKQESL